MVRCYMPTFTTSEEPKKAISYSYFLMIYIIQIIHIYKIKVVGEDNTIKVR